MLQSFKQLSAEPGTPLRQQPPNGRDVLAWLQQAQLKLQDAGIAQVSVTTRLDAAYDAVLFCCLAVACALRGLRCSRHTLAIAPPAASPGC
ncbi:MAG TPA: hypothetical protein VLA16_05185 [Ideonella sp.]|nr:hypothetical protein [Ideonella sp.]